MSNRHLGHHRLLIGLHYVGLHYDVFKCDLFHSNISHFFLIQSYTAHSSPNMTQLSPVWSSSVQYNSITCAFSPNLSIQFNAVQSAPVQSVPFLSMWSIPSSQYKLQSNYVTHFKMIYEISFNFTVFRAIASFTTPCMPLLIDKSIEQKKAIA